MTWGIEIVIGPEGIKLLLGYGALLLLLLIGVAIAATAILRRHPRLGELELNEAELGVGSAKIKLRPNYEDIQIAHKLWAEITTRKLGLRLDEDNDVISEVYDSWYSFFQVARELVKTIPAASIRRFESTREITSISVGVLNDVIRPHLTRWQAKFRRWYDAELQKQEHAARTPQEVQRTYPQYAELVSSMREVNVRVVRYALVLDQLAHS